MNDIFNDKVLAGSATPYLNPLGFQCDIGGISLIAMPPGKVDVTYEIERAAINIMPFREASLATSKLNGEATAGKFGAQKSATYFSAGSELELQCVNHGWELLVEADDEFLARLDAERTGGDDITNIEFLSSIDPVASALGQMAIAHLKEPIADRAYLEGLGLALTARVLQTAGATNSAPSVAGTDGRLNRAIDYIRADLTKSMTIADLAKIACMSPSWFSRAFRAQTGMTVHTYIQERRLERASLLLQTGSDSLASIAWDCGFADHSHLTRLFRKRYGITPSAARAT